MHISTYIKWRQRLEIAAGFTIATAAWIALYLLLIYN